MIIRPILFVIGSILMTVGLIGIYQMQTTVNCNIITEKSHNDWCNEISSRQYGTLDAMFFNGLALVILALVVTIKQSIDQRRLTNVH